MRYAVALLVSTCPRMGIPLRLTAARGLTANSILLSDLLTDN